jgi:hypothetical protein
MSLFFIRFPNHPARPAPPWCISAPPVKWYLGPHDKSRNPFLQKIKSFFKNNSFLKKQHAWTKTDPTRHAKIP